MPRVEFALLADRADYVNGKLYLAGGCWDRVTIRGPQHGLILSFAIGVQVLPDEAAEQHIAHITIGARGQPPLANLQVTFRGQGQAPQYDLPFQRAIVSLPAVPVVFPRTGVYELVANIVGHPPGNEVRTPFHVTVEQAQEAEAPPTE